MTEKRLFILVSRTNHFRCINYIESILFIWVHAAAFCLWWINLEKEREKRNCDIWIMIFLKLFWVVDRSYSLHKMYDSDHIPGWSWKELKRHCRIKTQINRFAFIDKCRVIIFITISICTGTYQSHAGKMWSWSF